jgi:lipopolysaccharide export system protein LptA
MNRSNLWRLLAAFLVLVPGAATALTSDRDQPISIEANTVDIDDRNDISTYSGDVQVKQGTMRLFADTVVLYGLREPSRITAEGSPVRFWQRPDDQNEDVRGEAMRLEYIIADDKLFLYEKAMIWQGENSFGSDRIEYDVNRELVRAGDREDRGKRVTVVIQPRKSDE